MKDTPKSVAVVGLGYVGLTFSTVLADVGFRVVGIEKRQDIVDLTNKGKPHFSEQGLSEALTKVVKTGYLTAKEQFSDGDQFDVFIITVGTPLDDNGNARIDMIADAAKQIADVMQDNALVILRSTVKVGVTRDIVKPILANSGKCFHLSMCPERTLEGRALNEIRELPQIVGADEENARQASSLLFQKLTNSVIQVSSYETAEILKLVDNTFRDVQFGFANEVAEICENFDVSAYEVIAAGKLGYPRTNVPIPGLVGGPCLEKDPHILVQSARSQGLEISIAAASRKVNELQPSRTVNFIISEAERRFSGGGVSVAILGMAFKGLPETDDLRGSMSIKVLNELKTRKPSWVFKVYDPVVRNEILEKHCNDCEVTNTFDNCLANTHIAVICNNHPRLGEEKPAHLLGHMLPEAFIYDYWNHHSKLSEWELGDSYFAVGNIGSRAG